MYQQYRDLLVAKCKQGAVLHMATDWQEYAEYMNSEMLADSRFVNRGAKNGVGLLLQSDIAFAE